MRSVRPGDVCFSRLDLGAVLREGRGYDTAAPYNEVRGWFSCRFVYSLLGSQQTSGSGGKYDNIPVNERDRGYDVVKGQQRYDQTRPYNAGAALPAGNYDRIGVNYRDQGYDVVRRRRVCGVL